MGRLSTVDLLVLTSLDQLIYILKIIFTFYKRINLSKEVNRTYPYPSDSAPWSVSHNSIDLAREKRKI